MRGENLKQRRKKELAENLLKVVAIMEAILFGVLAFETYRLMGACDDLIETLEERLNRKAKFAKCGENLHDCIVECSKIHRFVGHDRDQCFMRCDDVFVGCWNSLIK